MLDRATLMCAALLLSLASCGGPPPAPPTVVVVTVNATADNNPTADNTGAPLALRVYQLASAATFTAAEFFPLYNDDATALKADLVQRDNFLLAPSTSKTQTIMPKDNVAAIGVFGAYRSFQTATWRVSVDVAPHKTTTITVTAGHDGLTVKSDVSASK